MGKLSLYVTDTETTGFSVENQDIIEVSFLRVSDDEQRTWYLKAIHEDNISEEALEVNKHKLEDITWKTDDGKNKYRLPEEVLPEIENWLYEDGVTKLDRVLVGHNINFDSTRLEELWRRCGALESYPFGTNEIDTKALSVFLDWIQGANARRYSLSQIIKRLGLMKRRAHAASEDVLMTRDLMQYLFSFFSNLVDKSSVPLPLLGEEIEEMLPTINEEEENPNADEAAFAEGQDEDQEDD